MFGPISRPLSFDGFPQTLVQGPNADRRWHVDLRAGAEAGEHRGERGNHSAGGNLDIAGEYTNDSGRNQQKALESALGLEEI